MNFILKVSNNLKSLFFTGRSFILAFYTYLCWISKNNSHKLIIESKSLLKILHINTFEMGGGAAKIASDLQKKQQSNGINSNMLVGFKKSNIPFTSVIIKAKNKKQHFLQHAEKKLQWQDFFQLGSIDIINYIHFKEADIIHLHNLHGSYFSPFALQHISNSKPTVWTLHDMHAFTGHCAHAFDCKKWENGCGNCPDLNTYPAIKKDTTHFIWKTKSQIYRKSQIDIVVPSLWLMDKVKKSMLNHLPIHLIYNGIDTSIYKPDNKKNKRKELGLPEDRNIILFSSELGIKNPYKGGEFIEKIITRDDYKNTLFLNIGGGDSVVKNSNLWSIPYIKEQTEMAKYYSAADIFLYPSLADNCPLVILEAMACGLPIVTFKTGGIPELVLHNETGYIANYKDLEDLNNGIKILLENAELKKLMSQNAINRVIEKFTIEIMHQNYLKLYQNILKN